MKLLITILLTIAILGTTAQTYLPAVPIPSFDNSMTKNKWQVTPFASFSAGYVSFNGGSFYVAAPVGIALYHPLNVNWTAYGVATISPTIFNVNRLSTTPINDPNFHGYPFSGGYGLGLTTGIQGGLIYTNDARTFSISGSVQIERSSYPVYPSYKTTPTKQ